MYIYYMYIYVYIYIYIYQKDLLEGLCFEDLRSWKTWKEGFVPMFSNCNKVTEIINERLVGKVSGRPGKKDQKSYENKLKEIGKINK